MMKQEVRYIQDKLHDLFVQINGVKLRYEYREISDTHIIEVLPSEVYNQNEDYLAFETSFENEFQLLFPDQNIMFVSEDSLTEIKKPDIKLGHEVVQVEQIKTITNIKATNVTSSNTINSNNKFFIAA